MSQKKATIAEACTPKTAGLQRRASASGLGSNRERLDSLEANCRLTESRSAGRAALGKTRRPACPTAHSPEGQHGLRIALCDTCLQAMESMVFVRSPNQSVASDERPRFLGRPKLSGPGIRSTDSKRNKETEAQVPRSLE